MKPIPEGIMEKTWQEVAGFRPERAKIEIPILQKGILGLFTGKIVIILIHCPILI